MGEGLLLSANVPSADMCVGWKHNRGVRPKQAHGEGERGGRRGQITEDIDGREGASGPLCVRWGSPEGL